MKWVGIRARLFRFKSLYGFASLVFSSHEKLAHLNIPRSAAPMEIIEDFIYTWG